jgi:hypothetical protein
LDGDGSL